MKPAHRLTHPVLGSWLFKCPVYVRYEFVHNGRFIKVRAVRDLSPRQQLIANPKNCFDVVIAEIDVTYCSVTYFDYEAEEYAECDRTHADDDTFCIVCTIVTEEFIFTTGDFGNGSHILLHDGGYGVIVGVANFAVCEEGFGILSHASGNGMFGREGTVAELADLVHGNERTKVFLVHHLNLLVFVRSAEAVEEVDEGHAALTIRSCFARYY